MNYTAASRWNKIVQFPLTRLILGFAFVLGVTVLAQIAVQALPVDALPVLRLVRAAVIIAAALLAYVAFVRWVERRPVAELARRPAWWAEGMGGMAVGAVMFGITISLIALLGYYRVDGFNSWTVLIGPLAGAAVSGVFEELLFRGVMFRILEEWLGVWIALALSALLFGLLHALNPGATLWAGLAVALEAGVTLGAAYVFSRRLWLPMGLHFAWNFAQGGIFGVAVSGNEMAGLLRSTLAGPALWTGGAFGPEASVIALALGVLVGLGFLWMAYYRGHLERRIPQ